MTTFNTLWSGVLVAAVLAAASVLHAGGGQETAPQATSAAPHGSYLYRTYCASCHGESARGDGPLAASLRRRPPNLTEIAKRNNGTFNAEIVFKVIDGRQKVAGHGGPDMPVWGDAFQRSTDVRDEAAVAARIEALVAYLERIQARDTQ